jgi:hypothetical protein
VAAVIFFLAGVGIIKDAKGRVGALLGALVLIGLASLGFWAASSHGDIEGGISSLPTG